MSRPKKISKNQLFEAELYASTQDLRQIAHHLQWWRRALGFYTSRWLYGHRWTAVRLAGYNNARRLLTVWILAAEIKLNRYHWYQET